MKALPGLTRSIQLDFPGEAPLDQLSALFAGRVEFEREGERRLRGKYDPKSIPTGDLLKGILSSVEVADLSVEEPNIEEVIMKIYREGVPA